MVPCPAPSSHCKWRFDLFRRSWRAHTTCSLYFKMGQEMFPQNYHFPPGGSRSPHNIWFFGPTWVFIPMAFRSVQPVCRHTDHTTSVTLGHILMHCMRCNLITVTSGHDHIAIRHRSFNRFTRWHQSAPTWSWGLHISNGISTHSSIFAGLTLHIPYTVQEAARCPSKTAPSPGRGDPDPHVMRLCYLTFQ